MNLDFNELDKTIKSDEQIIDFGTLFNDCLIDLSEEMPRPEIILSIGDYQYKGDYYPNPIMTAGEFSAIIAQSKAKKSFLKSAFLGAYIGGNSVNLFPNIKSHRGTENYTVLDFDTEQGKYYTQRTFRRVQEMAGGIYENYKGFATRHLSSENRLKLIDYVLTNQAVLFQAPVKLVAIDGIADLVENTNDILMSKEASDFVMKWTYEHNIHITTVIHKSPQTGKPLGHLGTFVLKKAETVIELDVNEDGSVKVTNPYSRGYRFDEFSFDINKEALPYLIENF